eukprot:256365-Rhodomonas_salina.1
MHEVRCNTEPCECLWRECVEGQECESAGVDLKEMRGSEEGLDLCCVPCCYAIGDAPHAPCACCGMQSAHGVHG